MNLIKKLLVLLFLLALFVPPAWSEEDKLFNIVFSPEKTSGCNPYSNKLIYAAHFGRRIPFTIIVPKKKMGEFRKHGNLNFKIQFLDHRYQVLSEKKVKVSSFLRKGVTLKNGDYANFVQIKRPRWIKRLKKLPFGKEFFPASVRAVLVDRSNNVKASSAHDFLILPQKELLFEEVKDTVKVYSTPAVPDSELWDNSHGAQDLQVTHTLTQAVSERRKYEKKASMKIRLSVDSNGNYNVAARNINNGGNNPFWTTVLGTNQLGQSNPFQLINPGKVVNVSLAVNIDQVKKHTYQESDRFSIRHRFSLMPGEAGIIFYQEFFRTANFQIFGPDRCNFVSLWPKLRRTFMLPSYNMLLVDKAKLGDPNYLEELAEKELTPIEE